jgi:hypothetical protein
MRRTQIYLTTQEHSAASELARQQERTLSDVVRDALDAYIAASDSSSDWRTKLRAGRGMWKDRTDLPDFDEMRRSWDRDVFGERPD